MSYEVAKFIKPKTEDYDCPPIMDTEEDLRIFRESRNLSPIADAIRAEFWPEDEPEAIIEDLLEYTVCLASEWDWKRDSTSSNNQEMNALDKAITRAKRYLTVKDKNSVK